MGCAGEQQLLGFSDNGQQAQSAAAAAAQAQGLEAQAYAHAEAKVRRNTSGRALDPHSASPDFCSFVWGLMGTNDR